MTVLLVDGGLQQAVVGGGGTAGSKLVKHQQQTVVVTRMDGNGSIKMAIRSKEQRQQQPLMTSTPKSIGSSNNNNNSSKAISVKSQQQQQPSTKQQQLLTPEHRHAVNRLVADARLPDDFWSYYKGGRGRLTMPAVPSSSSAVASANKAKVTSITRPVSAEVSMTEANNLTSELETVNQFLIFLNALRLFSFFQLASQLESVVLPDRCIRVSLSGNFRRRGELQLCIGISRLRLPFTTSSGVVTRQWIRCCRFKPRHPPHPAPALQQPQPAEKCPDNADEQTMPLLDGVDTADVDVKVVIPEQKLRTNSTLLTAATRASIIDDRKKQVAAEAEKSRNRRNSKKWFFRKLLACCCISGNDDSPKMKKRAGGGGDVDVDEDAHISASRRNLYKPDANDLPLVVQKPVLIKRPQPSDFLAVDVGPNIDAEDLSGIGESDASVLQAVHEHFVKSCVDEPTELSEFVEKTIGALFFDVRGGDAKSYDDCCGLEALPLSSGRILPPSHVGVSICFTAPLQLSKLERCLSDRSFLTAVKSIVFPFVYRPASSSFLSTSLSATSSGPVSPATATGSDIDDSCHGRSPALSPPLSVKSPQQKIIDDDPSPVLTLSANDVELFVVVRQTSIRSVIADLEPPSSTTNTSGVLPSECTATVAPIVSSNNNTAANNTTSKNVSSSSTSA